MYLNELIDPFLMQEHIKAGLVSMQTHPEDKYLAILNYTHRAQYETTVVLEEYSVVNKSIWGDGTIDWCRGLIYDTQTGRIVALPFKKFHNLNTIGMPETLYENLPWGRPYSAAEKVDGSLGIYYKRDNVEGIATRGSFTSAQALFATDWFKENIYHNFWPEHITPLFEIVYPENRIVVDYRGYSGLVLLGMMNKNTAEEVPWTEVQDVARGKIRLASDYSDMTVQELMNVSLKNIEGFVVTFKNGLKVKIKTDEYKRLHRIMACMNPHTLWESLRNGNAAITPGELPDNFKRWYRLWTGKLIAEFNAIRQEAKDIFFRRPDWSNPLYAHGYRSACAEYFKTAVGNRTYLLPVLFFMLDGKDSAPAIWKLVEPRGDDQTFKSSVEVDA